MADRLVDEQPRPRNFIPASYLLLVVSGILVLIRNEPTDQEKNPSVY